MIEKLRRKLMLLFLIFTMLAFTALLALVMVNTVVNMHNAEKLYTERIADGIIEELQQGIVLTEERCALYASKFQTWVSLSNKIAGPESFATPTAYLLDQIGHRDGVAMTEEIAVSQKTGTPTYRTIWLLTGLSGEQYYAIQTVFTGFYGTEETLLVLHPLTSVWSILQTNWAWYLLIWFGMLVMMYGISRFLIQKALQPVAASITSQKEFIAAASHELKAPLAVILANAETLSTEQTTIQVQQKQKVIVEECSRMSGLVQSMLALASSDAGKWNMTLQCMNIDTLLIETWERFQDCCQQKDISLQLMLEDTTYPVVQGDGDRLAQMLAIFLDNAIGYSTAGSSIELGATVEGNMLLFFVVDHGPGIRAAEKEKVFDRFYQGDPSRTEQTHYGLGLSIAKEIVTMHQGNIILTDTPGGGCTFKIYLPCQPMK